MSIGVRTERLPRTLQKLIDARLDTIDRMLLGRLPRADRLGVTRDVEGQIYDLLGERPGHELDREDVLTVLARLDPPEAYIPEEGGMEAAAVLLPSSRVARSVQRPDLDRKRALVMGIVGLLVLGMVLFYPLLFLASEILGELAIVPLVAWPFLSAAAAVATLVLSILWLKGGAWAVVGVVTGAIGVAASLVEMVWVFLNL